VISKIIADVKHPGEQSGKPCHCMFVLL